MLHTQSKDIDQRIQSLTQFIQDTKAAFEKGQQQQQHLLQQQHSLEGQITANQSSLATLQKELNQWMAQWNEQPKPPLNDTQHSLEIAQSAIVQQQFEEQQNQFDQLRQVILEKKHLQKQWKADLAKRKTLATQHQSLANRKAHLNTLTNLFKGNGFVDYISSIYLEELCELANERFRKLTRQRLSLAINDKNQFIVRDYLNQGNTRNVKTLSGGQLFQASLSLALALAENIKHRHGSTEQFFFIDEGFGTQDEQSLQLILQTLKSLRNEGRIVGIISHLNQLKQEIDVYLAVENDELKGSIVKSSF